MKILEDIDCIDSAEVGKLVCERISHSLRTPLGVALGVVDDLCNGLELTNEDYSDARKALKQIQGILDEVRDLGNELQGG